MKTRIVNIKKEPYDIYIGRGSPWGNPFKIGEHGTRKEVIAKYKEWILTQKDLLRSLSGLEGKRLGCFCKPKACHGDVLIKLIREQIYLEF